jgi:hypothetical protein
MAKNLTSEQLEEIKHWSAFGQRGKTPDHRVQPWEWQNKPFKTPIRSPWKVRIEPHELPLLLLGFIPRPGGVTGPPSTLHMPGESYTCHIIMSASERKDVTPSEDKWFIYADGPGHGGEVRLHMHRSWTGNKQVEFVIDAGHDGYGKEGEGASVTAIIWESDPELAWKDGDEEKYKEVAREVCYWVLSVQLERSKWDHRSMSTMTLEEGISRLPASRDVAFGHGRQTV